MDASGAPLLGIRSCHCHRAYALPEPFHHQLQETDRTVEEALKKGGIEAAKQKHDVIMTPNTYLYFDYYQAKDVDNEPFGIGGYLPLERVYSYEPMPASLTPEEQKYIKGVQANLWTEYIATFPHAQYMVLPRWAALCEIQWSSPEKKNYADFLSRLPQLIKWYDAEGYN